MGRALRSGRRLRVPVAAGVVTALADQATLVPGVYRLPEDPVGPDVLIPGFRSSEAVLGAFGWFTAGWIERLAPGLAVYLNRDDTGPIEFTVAPWHYPAEIEAMERAQALSVDEGQARVAEVLTGASVEQAETALAQHALDCMTWMIATGKLSLRIAVPTAGSNYHPKFWFFREGQDQLIVRGSGNATSRGIDRGVEHFDVDVSWVPASRTRVQQGVRIMEDWRRGRSQGIERVVALEEALRQRIIEVAPDVAPKAADYDAAVVRDGNPPWAAGAKRRPKAPRLEAPDWLNWRTGRYAHQKEAVDAWEGDPEPERGTIAMATGAGKTLTALVCAARCQERLPAESPFAVVVAAPSVPLVLQWRGEIARFGIRAATPTVAGDTDAALTNFFRGLRRDGTHVMVITNNLLCTEAFRTTMGRMSRGVPTLLIADEAHRLGAHGFIDAPPEFFQRRLALSATPERQYDPDGTEAIFRFFGPPVYDFGLDRAIGFCLVPYDYLVHAGVLEEEELDDFLALTRRIGERMAFGDDLEDDSLLRLLLRRRRIVENAGAKLPLLRAVLRRRGRSLEQALIYASAKNPAQFETIGSMLDELEVRWAPVTQETTASAGKLERTLDAFRDGGYQVLLAKKVLDEGVDIPGVREAFIVASSSVEREWVQRRGRVLRRHPGKSHAVVHDFLALPPRDIVARGDKALGGLVANELERAYAFAGHARNAAGEDGALAVIRRLREAYWPDSSLGGRRILKGPGEQILAPGTWRERTG